MTRAQWRVTLGVAAVLLTGAAGRAATTTPRVTRPAPRPLEQVRPSARVVGQYQKLELTVQLRGSYTNPFDPTEVDVVGRFVTPSGKVVRVPGFFFQDYARSQATDGSEVLTPRGRSAFKVRFAWGEVGAYSYSVSVRDRAGLRAVGSGTFTVQASADPGYVRRSAAAPHYFQFDSGASYFPIGENICWPGGKGTYDYDAWLNKLADNGGNYTRLWLVNEWNMLGLENRAAAGEGNGLGRYSLKAAWRVDYIAELARQRNSRLMLCFDSFNSLASGTYGMWSSFAYNAANGGPCATPADFFTNEEAKRLFKQRLRYLVARWGYSPNVMAWEFWNEVDLVDGYQSTPVAAWHQEMGDYLRSIDPWQHLITTSFANSPGDPAVDELPQMEYVQTHSYGTHDAAETVRAFTKMKLDDYGKPTYLGEFGIDWQPDSYPADPTGVHLHNALWASAHVGAAGTPMTWWWDNYIEPNNLYYHFARLAAYLAGVDWVQEDYAPAQVTRVAYAAGTTPTYTSLAIEPPGESWEDSVLNQPHVFTVGNDGSVSNLEVMSRVLHGVRNHPTWHNPATFLVNYPVAGRFTVSVNAVSGWGGAALRITRDGTIALTADFPDPQPDTGDTLYQYNGAYGIDVPAGAHTIVVEDTGNDWFYCSYALTNYVTAPNLRVLAMANSTSALVWAQNKEHTWWNLRDGATPTALPACEITLAGLTPGSYQIEQWDTYAGTVAGTSSVTCTDGTITLTTPAGLTTDLAWKLRRTG